jgi:beta-galactosidase
MMIQRVFSLMILLCVVNRSNAQQILFNDDWQFHKGDITNDGQSNNDTATWRKVMLPHDWSIEGPFSDEWASATGYLPGGIGWYKKTFNASSSWQSKKIFIYFDGVYKNSTVWLNDHYIGNRPNGFIPFEYELTKYLNYNGKNTLTVKVDHKDFADSRWYTGSGIYRNVYLNIKEPVHLVNWGVEFSATNISVNKADCDIKVAAVNQSGSNQNITIEYSLQNKKGVVVAKGNKPFNIQPNDTTINYFHFTVDKPELWSVDDPSLYDLTVTIVDNKKITDKYTDEVGIRSIRVDADRGFFLNGKNIKLKGVCIHDDAGALGVAVPEVIWRSRLQTLKELGCNSIRMSHNPHADYMYRLCDELGFLVLDEAFDEWEVGKNKWIQGWNVGKPGKDGYNKYFKDWADIDLRDMILRNYNHACIIAWSIGNEIDYPNDPYSSKVLSKGNNPQIYGKGYLPDHPSAQKLGELSKQLVAVVKKYDTTRPVTAALAGVVMSNETTYPGNLDWVGYNYQEYRYKDDHATYPERKIYGSENGKQLSAWNAVDSNEYISAQYLWTGIDYLGEAGKWPQRSNDAGLIDLAGFTKPEYYFRQSLWSDKPMIYIGTTKNPNDNDKNIWRNLRAEPTWNWTENDSVRVNCFTNCDEAELFLNGKPLGKKSLASFQNKIINWTVTYKPGTLKVVGYKKGIVVTQSSLQTGGNAYAIKAIVIKDTIGKSGVVQIPLSIVDKNGSTVYDAENEITVSINGNANLLGLESGSTSSHENYKNNKRKTVHGKMMAYVLLPKNATNITVEFAAEGLRSEKIKL